MENELARVCVENLNQKCTCSKMYIDRRLKDPSCEYCDIGQYILPLADKILASKEPVHPLVEPTDRDSEKYTQPVDFMITMTKQVLFEMWERVESGQFDSRSYVGDTALRLRCIFYQSDDKLFFKEYEKRKSKSRRNSRGYTARIEPNTGIA